MKKRFLPVIGVVITLFYSPLFSQQNQGYGTYYGELGTPYGACGVPQEIFETEHFVALNMFDSPGNYGNFTRPLAGNNLQYMGEFANGQNCGRWVKVDIGRFCQNGTNDGAANQAFCRGTNAQLVADKYTGASMYFIVADGCPDPNAWCRDNYFHLDIVGTSINLFENNGVPVGDMYPNKWNNREINWEYVEAPYYSGDINIYFIKDAQQFWPTILINNLSNGIHGVEQKVGSNWVAATMNADMGQSYTLPNNSMPYRIRITDADNQLLNNGREYIFSLPSSCNPKCSPVVTPVNYTTSGGVVTSIEADEELSQGAYFFTVEDGMLIAHRRIKTSQAEETLVVMDMKGQELVSKQASQHQAIALTSIKKGAYLVAEKNQDRLVKTHKVLY
jgi:hypothetical protein